MTSALILPLFLCLALVINGHLTEPDDLKATDPAPSSLQSSTSSLCRLPSALRRWMPSSKTLKTVLIALLAMTPSGSASRICINNHPPALPDVPFAFCVDYSVSEACLAPIGSRFPDHLYRSEALIANDFHEIQFGDGSGSCPDLVQRVVCSAADPWSSTLFRDDHERIPRLCSPFSSLIWDVCARVSMKPNPFAPVPPKPLPNDQATTLIDVYDTKDAFQRTYAVDQAADHCYNGVPVDQTMPVASLPRQPSSRYLGQVCVQRQRFDIGSNQFILGGAPYPTDPDQMAIVDKAGVVSLWKFDGGAISSTPWLDLGNQVHSDGNGGLLSLAFHKEFESNGRLFLSLTCAVGDGHQCQKNGDLVVDEYRVEDPAQPTTPVFVQRLLVVDAAFGSNFGGQLLFSPSSNDDNLYVFVGDGGQHDDDDAGDPLNAAQDLESLHGKVLRLNVDGVAPYEIPDDNPFQGVDGARGEIFALGLHHPWRCSFDRALPEFLFCADVGQHRYEEVNRIIAGGNYGWRFYEGRAIYNSAKGLRTGLVVPPQIEYPHLRPNAPAAVIGGYVYRPNRESTIAGTYFFADEFGKLYSAVAVPESGVYTMTPAYGAWRCASDSPTPCGKDIGLVFSFFESANGVVYVSTSKGIFKITDPEDCSLD